MKRNSQKKEYERKFSLKVCVRPDSKRIIVLARHISININLWHLLRRVWLQLAIIYSPFFIIVLMLMS